MIKAMKASILVIVCMMFMVAVTGYAQNVTGAIVGTVKDATGAVVNTATVTASNLDTGFSRSVPTNGAGEYRIDNLPVGKYTVTVSAPSFEDYAQQNLSLDLDQTLAVPVKLTAGAESTTVTVTSAPPQVNVSTAEVGKTITGDELEELPLVNRNALTELSLTPGVMSNSADPTKSSTPDFQVGQPVVQVQINGSIDGGNPEVGFFLDGGSNITGTRNYGNQLPQPDALQEFRVETNSFSPQFGHFSSAVVFAVTKSGTNSFHGGLFEFHRETFLNDTNWGVSQMNKAPYHRNNFGIYLGGPIVKDKAFLFLSYAGLQQVVGQVLTGGVVPTGDANNCSTLTTVHGGSGERCGDFTGDTFAVYNPKPASAATSAWYLTPVSSPGTACTPGTSNNQVCGINSSPNCLTAKIGCINTTATTPTYQTGGSTPYTGAAPVAAFLDPAIQAILKSGNVPLSNIAQTAKLQGTGGAGYAGAPAVPTTDNEYLVKFTANLTPKDQLGVTYFYITTISDPINGTAPTTSYGTTQSHSGQTNGNVSWLHTFTPNVQNNLWLTFTRNSGGRVNLPATGLDTFGGSTFRTQGVPFLPDLAINTGSTLGSGLAGPVTTSNWLELRDLITVTRGKHTLTLGGSIASDKNMLVGNLNNFGIFQFNASAPSSTDNSFSDFITGQVNLMEQDTPYHTLMSAWHTGIFVNDSYRATPRLTANIGIRWDIDTPPVESSNLTASWVPGQVSTQAGLPTGELVPGDAGISRGIIQTRYSHIAPRLGIAWDPFGDGKTAIRAGAGLFFGSTSGNEWNQPGNGYPYALRPGAVFNIRSVTDVYNPLLNDGVTGSSFPTGDFITNYHYTPGVAPQQLTLEGIETIPPAFKWPYSYQFNFAVQRQLPFRISATVSYVAALSHSVPTMVDNNYAPYSTAYTADKYTGGNGAPCKAFNANGVSMTASSCQEARRPSDSGPGGTAEPVGGIAITGCSSAGTCPTYPNAGTLGTNIYLRSDQTASYHSLQITASRPMTHNLMINGYYVWAHALQSSNESAIGLIALQDYNNLREERGPMAFDARNTAVISALWKINYYHGSNFAMKEALNGWSIAPVAYFHTGNPFEMLSGSNNLTVSATTPNPSGLAQINDVYGNQDSSNHNRPDIVPGINPALSHHRCRVGCVNSEAAAWFNTAAFTYNGPGLPGTTGGIGPGGADGNVGWDTMRGPGYRDVDLGVYRDVVFPHGVKFQLRVEATNAFNMVSLNNPTASLSSGTDATITGASTPRLIQIGGKLSF